jgi:hypothetical protein
MDKASNDGTDRDREIREAFDRAFGAMLDWRNEIKASADLYGKKAFDELEKAATAAGWPASLVETTRSQLLQASKLQADMIDYMLSAWKHQLEAHDSPAAFQGMLDRSTPGQTVDLADLAMAPTQFWLQATNAWQKSWTDAMEAWMRQSPGRSRSD